MLSQELATKKCKALVSSLETFGSVDGPGVRYVVFLQGCNLRCRYCHNPETWTKTSPDAKEWSPEDLFNLAWRYHFYWGKDLKNGGITVSGGEPLLQIDFLIEFFKLAKAKGVHTCIDTAGQPFSRNPEFLEKFNELMKFTDLFMVDIKAFDPKLHKELTGFENQNILDFMKYLSDNGKAMWIRHVLVPKLTDSEEDLINTRNFIESLKTVERVEVLPYHTLGIFKWKKLGIKYSLEDAEPPTDEEVLRAEKLLNVNKYKTNK